MPRIRREILTTLLLHPDDEWYQSDLARHLNTRPSSLTRELRDLTEAGIIRRRASGRRSYYQADTRSPLFPELRGLIQKTTGVVSTLRSTLERFQDRIRAAFIFGSVASGIEHTTSDIDLVVIGDVGLRDLAIPLRDAQKHLAREINASVYSPQEFAERSIREDSFLHKVIRRDKLMIIGTEDDMA